MSCYKSVSGAYSLTSFISQNTNGNYHALAPQVRVLVLERCSASQKIDCSLQYTCFSEINEISITQLDVNSFCMYKRSVTTSPLITCLRTTTKRWDITSNISVIIKHTMMPS